MTVVFKGFCELCCQERDEVVDIDGVNVCIAHVSEPTFEEAKQRIYEKEPA